MAISLKKAEEKVIISLKKKEVLTPPTCRVGLAVDVSGSMHTYFSSGAVSDIVTRILALAKTFDDNGEMEVWAFDHGVTQTPNVTEDNYEKYVNTHLKPLVGGGTSYTPCLRAINDFYFSDSLKTTEFKSEQPATGFFGRLFGKSKVVTSSITETVPASEEPTFVVFITDGATSDATAAMRQFERSQDKPIYWLLVGAGDPSDFAFLRKTAEKLPNVGYLQFDSLHIEDEVLYDGIISHEFIDWFSK